ncbi:hypothetical protein YPPY13_4564, partial [Yersinia pestis PY-13]
MIERLFFSP